MIKPGSRVKIRDEYLDAVSSYQYKALGYRPLVGVVKEKLWRRYVVDFTQEEGENIRSRYGEKARVNCRHELRGPGFPLKMLEEVDDA
jgi:hypothetical protein